MSLVLIMDVAKELGVHPARIHQMCKAGGILKVKKGGRSYIEDADLKEHLAKHPLQTRGSRKVRGGKDDDAPRTSARGKFASMEQRPEFLLWNKGEWRGWAIATIDSVDDVICEGITDYGKKFMWIPSKVAEEVAAGTMFLMDPAQTVHFIAMQLLRVKEKEGISGVVRALEQAAKELEAIKERETAEGG